MASVVFVVVYVVDLHTIASITIICRVIHVGVVDYDDDVGAGGVDIVVGIGVAAAYAVVDVVGVLLCCRCYWLLLPLL